MTWPMPLLRIATAWRPAMNALISGASSPWIAAKSCLAFIRSAAPPASRPQPGYRRATSRKVRMTFGALPVQNSSHLMPLCGLPAIGGFGAAAGVGPAGMELGPTAGPGAAGAGGAAGVEAGAGAGGGMRPMNSGGATSRATAWLPAERCSAATCEVPKPVGTPALPEENARTDAAIGVEKAPIGAAPTAAGEATSGAGASSCSICGWISGMEPAARTYPRFARKGKGKRAAERSATRRKPDLDREAAEIGVREPQLAAVQADL